jgi:hypothetical protein
MHVGKCNIDGDAINAHNICPGKRGDIDVGEKMILKLIRKKLRYMTM